jgi:DNA helicase-2/ATP-dependent DNA helicase PcrA
MRSNSNRAVIACAGSGKTTSIVEGALQQGEHQRILVVTYTNENVEELRGAFMSRAGVVPPNVHVVSWFVFLLRDGVRPYQNHLVSRERVRTVLFELRRQVFRRKADYLSSAGDIYGDKVSEFVVECNRVSGGLIVRRLERMYDQIFVDEVQDFAGYDLDLLQQLFLSSIHVTVVGDPRQATFSTNRAMRNKQYRGSQVYEWLKQREAAGEVTVEDKAESHRCNQEICAFADRLYPDYPKTTSLNSTRTSHDGIFQVPMRDVGKYVEMYQPVVLRYSKATSTAGLRGFNIGVCKGRTFDRVLIFPTNKMLAYLRTMDATQAGDASKFYVAVTRARYSVAFVIPY